MKYTELQTEIKNAMKNKDTLRRDTLRQVLNEVKNIEINERREIQEADVDAMLKRVHKQLKETTDASIIAGDNPDRTNKLMEQVEIINEYMPTIVEGEALTAAIDSILLENKSANMGFVMKELNNQFNGNFDKRAASTYIKNVLN